MRKARLLFSLLVATILISGVFVYAQPDEAEKDLRPPLERQNQLDKKVSAVDYIEAGLISLLEGEGEAKADSQGVSSNEKTFPDYSANQKEAKAHYQKIISYNTQILNDPNSTYPQRLEALQEIYRLNIQNENYDEAVNLLKNSLAQYPDNRAISNYLAEALYFQAMQYAIQGEPDKAIENSLYILDMTNISDDWQPFIKNYLASLYLAEGNDKEALYWYNRITSDHSNLRDWPASARYSIAEYYQSQGDYKKAKEQFNTIITKYPTSFWVKQAKDKLKEIPSK